MWKDEEQSNHFDLNDYNQVHSSNQSTIKQ